MKHLNATFSTQSALTLNKVLLGMSLAIASSVSSADWTYLNGPNSWNSSSGLPNTLETLSIPNTLQSAVVKWLPEGIALPNNPTQYAQLTDDAGANIPFIANATVKVAYVFEGAGYQNSVGFFTFSTANKDTVDINTIKQAEKIMFPNFSDNVLSLGKAVNIGSVSAGQSLGFTIVSNGWQSGQVNPNKSSNGIFRTIKRLNPESSNNNKHAHTVLFADPSHSMLVLAFEDLNRASCSNNDYGYCTDDDFNDVVIAIQVTPFSAVDPTNIQDIGIASGISGPANWREVTSSPTVTDPIKAAAKEIMKAKNSQP